MESLPGKLLSWQAYAVGVVLFNIALAPAMYLVATVFESGAFQ